MKLTRRWLERAELTMQQRQHELERERDTRANRIARVLERQAASKWFRAWKAWVLGAS